MKKHLRSFIIVLTVLFLVSSIFAGCSKPAGKTEATSKPAESTVAEKTVEATKAPPMDILWCGPANSAGNGIIMHQGGEIELELDKIFNVNLKPVEIDIWAGDTLSTLIGSGTIPDVWNAEGNVSKWQKQGVIREISKDLITKYAPTVAKKIDEVDKSGWMKASVDGKLYGVPNINEQSGIPWVNWYRADWAENVGIAKTPETLDEFEVMLKKFTFDNPAKNGKKTYGLSSHSEWGPEMWRWAEIFGAFGVFPKNWMNIDGKIAYGGIQPGYKEALKYLQKLYKEGVIDPEFATQKSSQYTEKLTNGQIGVDDTDMTSARDSLNQSAQVKNKEAKFEFIPRLTGPEGKYTNWSWGAADGWVMVFGKDVPDEKVGRILEMLERFATDGEVFKLAMWGKKGVHYDLKGDLVVPKPDFNTDEAARAKIGLGSLIYGYYTYLNRYKEQFKYFFSSSAVKDTEDITKVANPVTNAIYTPLQTNSKYGADLSKIANKFYYDAITGKINIDAEWDKYVQSWLKAGGEETTKEANEVYATYPK